MAVVPSSAPSPSPFLVNSNQRHASELPVYGSCFSWENSVSQSLPKRSHLPQQDQPLPVFQSKLVIKNVYLPTVFTLSCVWECLSRIGSSNLLSHWGEGKFILHHCCELLNIWGSGWGHQYTMITPVILTVHVCMVAWRWTCLLLPDEWDMDISTNAEIPDTCLLTYTLQAFPSGTLWLGVFSWSKSFLCFCSKNGSFFSIVLSIHWV